MNRILSLFLLFVFVSVCVTAQVQTSGGLPPASGMAMSPARFELEMKPGTETTVIVNLDYHTAVASTQPTRIIASLNDWTITKDGRVEYYRANSRADSASSWLIYSPGEAAVMPGTVHQIRVTISVPLNATPGDHLTALIIEQRPDTLKFEQNTRQVIVRYRMASVFYIKVPGLTRHGDFGDLLAESRPDGILITPTLRNEGNSVIRPVSSVKVLDAAGQIVADIPDFEPLPILAGSESTQAVAIGKNLPPGNYTVKYRVDFQDGGKATEGITDLVVKAAVPQIASTDKAPKKP